MKSKLLKTGNVYTLYPEPGECPFQAVRQRYKKMKQINARLKFTEAGLKNLAKTMNYDYVVVNDVVNKKQNNVLLADEFKDKIKNSTASIGMNAKLSFRWSDVPGMERNIIKFGKEEWFVPSIIDDPMKENTYNTNFMKKETPVIIDAPLEK